MVEPRNVGTAHEFQVAHDGGNDGRLCRTVKKCVHPIAGTNAKAKRADAVCAGLETITCVGCYSVECAIFQANAQIFFAAEPALRKYKP